MCPLNTYWDNHLRVAFEQSAAHDLPAMVEASLAHVAMLTGTGALPPERGALLETGLLRLWEQWGDGMDTPDFDGSVEDPYYYFEAALAATLGIPSAELDVQLARSRNDLDSAVFRMILRRMLLDHADQLRELIAVTLDRAEATVDALIIGMTHRRPAQPTTIAHVLVGMADAWLECLNDLVQTYDELNVSPLGGAAFAGTDIAYDADRVAGLLGFDRLYNSSYEAIAGAGHLTRVAAVHGRIAAQSARFARVLQEWMSERWIVTPLGFTQGSSIMPQKVNPVVCEHLVSMAGATLGDVQSVYVNVAASWYEDSNNATTDVQQHLWRSSERLERILRLQTGLAAELEVLELPDPADIVATGATTTAVAEALSGAGVPWRGAHSAVHDLIIAGAPGTWTLDAVAEALRGAGIDEALTPTVLSVAQRPDLALTRTQPGSPGRAPMAAAIATGRERLVATGSQLDARRTVLDTSRERLLAVAGEVAGGQAG